MSIFARTRFFTTPMSKTGEKIFKYALDKGRRVKNSLWIAG